MERIGQRITGRPVHGHAEEPGWDFAAGAEYPRDFNRHDKNVVPAAELAAVLLRVEEARLRRAHDAVHGEVRAWRGGAADAGWREQARALADNSGCYSDEDDDDDVNNATGDATGAP